MHNRRTGGANRFPLCAFMTWTGKDLPVLLPFRDSNTAPSFRPPAPPNLSLRTYDGKYLQPGGGDGGGGRGAAHQKLRFCDLQIPSSMVVILTDDL
jgi:hypothetical protein